MPKQVKQPTPEVLAAVYAALEQPMPDDIDTLMGVTIKLDNGQPIQIIETRIAVVDVPPFVPKIPDAA